MYQPDETTSEVCLRATGLVQSLFDPEFPGDATHPTVITKWATRRNSLPHRGQRVDGFASIDPIDPIIRPDDRPIAERYWVKRADALRQASPRPVFCTSDESGPKRIALHIATDGVEVAV